MCIKQVVFVLLSFQGQCQIDLTCCCLFFFYHITGQSFSFTISQVNANMDEEVQQLCLCLSPK